VKIQYVDRFSDFGHEWVGNLAIVNYADRIPVVGVNQAIEEAEALVREAHPDFKVLDVLSAPWLVTQI
jgi:hypothetical protein